MAGAGHLFLSSSLLSVWIITACMYNVSHRFTCVGICMIISEYQIQVLSAAQLIRICICACIVIIQVYCCFRNWNGVFPNLCPAPCGCIPDDKVSNFVEATACCLVLCLALFVHTFWAWWFYSFLGKDGASPFGLRICLCLLAAVPLAHYPITVLWVGRHTTYDCCLLGCLLSKLH
jgi:hypothetical protein